jgi:CubicO group peptidase (beta-lactamase class C family)
MCFFLRLYKSRTVGAAVLMSAAILPFPTAPAASQAAIPMARIDSIFIDLDHRSSPGCALSVMRRGSTVVQGDYGMANMEYGVPITSHSVFHVASVSKQFTAFAVGLLVADGRLSWEDDIRRYVPEVPDFGDTMTLRHLVHHTSGLRDQWHLLSLAGWRFDGDLVTLDDVLHLTSLQTRRNFQPGERFLYSNTGFTLLAVVVERVTGERFGDFTRRRMFEPLGMADTHFHDDHTVIVPNRAYAYAPTEDGGFRMENPNYEAVGPAGLFTTVEDLARWDRNLTEGIVGGCGCTVRPIPQGGAPNRRHPELFIRRLSGWAVQRCSAGEPQW